MASTDYPLMQYAYFNRFWITDVAIGQGETTRESSVYSNTVSGFCFLGGGGMGSHHHLASITVQIFKHLEM